MRCSAALRNDRIAHTFGALDELGVAAIELEFNRDGSLPQLFGVGITSDAALGELHDALTAQKVKPSALLLGTDFAADDPLPSLDWTLCAIAAAEALGAPAVRIDVTHWAPGLSMEKIREALRAVCFQHSRSNRPQPGRFGHRESREDFQRSEVPRRSLRGAARAPGWG